MHQDSDGGGNTDSVSCAEGSGDGQSVCEVMHGVRDDVQHAGHAGLFRLGFVGLSVVAVGMAMSMCALALAAVAKYHKFFHDKEGQHALEHVQTHSEPGPMVMVM